MKPLGKIQQCDVSQKLMIINSFRIATEDKGYFLITSKALLLVSCTEYGTHTTEEFNLGKKKERKPQEKTEPQPDRSCYETLVNHLPSLANILLFEETVMSITIMWQKGDLSIGDG